MWEVEPLTPDTASRTYVKQIIEEPDYARARWPYAVGIVHFLEKVTKNETKLTNNIW
jgi:hypothetical protein